MDLSGRNLDQKSLAELMVFIQQRKLAYQPFRFDDQHEVGEGMAFLGGTSTTSRKGVVAWEDAPDDIADLLVRPQEKARFRAANGALRAVYDHFIESVCAHLGGDIGTLDFAEFGCNTGYFPYSLLLRGARSATGLDFTNNQAVFAFFNRVLGISAGFAFSEWDSFRHEPRYNVVPEVDVCLSVAVLCHLADPLHHLTYLCSRARKAVFLWTPSHKSTDLFMSFGQPALFQNSLAWPLSFDNGIKPSEGLLELCLRSSGFEDIRHLAPIPTELDEIGFWKHHTGIVAFRTGPGKTAYEGGAVRRLRPSDAPADELPADSTEPAVHVINRPVAGSAPPILVRESSGYNIVSAAGRWYAIPLGVEAELDRDDPADIPGLLEADSAAQLEAAIRAHPLPPAPPRQTGVVGRFNVVSFRDRWFAIPFGLRVDWEDTDVASLPGVLTGGGERDVTMAAKAASGV